MGPFGLLISIFGRKKLRHKFKKRYPGFESEDLNQRSSAVTELLRDFVIDFGPMAKWAGCSDGKVHEQLHSQVASAQRAVIDGTSVKDVIDDMQLAELVDASRSIRRMPLSSDREARASAGRRGTYGA